MAAAERRAPRPVIVKPTDARLAMRWRDNEAGWEQVDDDEPVYIVVGSDAPADRLESLASRFGVPLAQLRAARAR